jgi:hypothetical protein
MIWGHRDSGCADDDDDDGDNNVCCGFCDCEAIPGLGETNALVDAADSALVDKSNENAGAGTVAVATAGAAATPVAVAVVCSGVGD